MIITDNCWTSFRIILDDAATDTSNNDYSNPTQDLADSTGFFAGYFHDDYGYLNDTWTTIIIKDFKKAKRNLGPLYNDHVPKHYYPPVNIPDRIQLNRRIL